MTTTDKTTTETASTPDASSGRDRYHDHIKTAAGVLVAGFGFSLLVAFAMGWDRDRYLRYVGLVAVLALLVTVIKAYRTYVHPGRPPVVEETTPDEPDQREVA